MKNRLLILCFFITSCLWAQQPPAAPLKWGKITDAETALTTAPGGAPAVVLADFGRVKVDAFVKGPTYRFRQHRRIKIFEPDNYELNDIQVDFYAADDQEDLSNFRVQLFDPSGKKLSLDKNSIVVTQLPDGRTRHSISLPSLSPGSIVEYQYDLDSRRVQQLRTWYFQEEIPVLHSEYRVEKPRGMDYAARWFGIDSLVEATYTEPTPRLVEEGRNWGIAGDFKVYIEAERYVSKNAPAFPADRCMSTSTDYRTGVTFYLREIIYPDGSKRVYMDTWENLTQILWEHARLGRQLTETDQTDQLVAAAAALIRSRESNEKKVQRMHDWLLEKVKREERYSIYSDQSLDVAFEQGLANSGERNLMLLKLMQAAGMEVYPVLVSTRDHGKVAQQYPFAPQFNHLLVYWQVAEDDYQILDVVDEYLPAGYPRPEALNGAGWLLQPESPRWVDLQPSPAVDIYLVTAELLSDGNCELTTKATYTGYAAYERRKTDAEERWADMLGKQQSGFVMEDIRSKYETEIEQPYKEYVSCLRTAPKPMDGELSLHPILFSRFMMPYPEENRPYPIDMMYPLHEQYIFILRLPEEYEVVKLPETRAGSLGDGGALFLYDVMQRNGIVQVVSKIQINQLKYTPEEYPNVRSFFKLILDKFGEEIVLRKTENN